MDDIFSDITPEYFHGICTDAVFPDVSSPQTLRQYINSRLDLLANFDGTPAEYESLAYSIILCVCEMINNAPAKTSELPIPAQQISELRKKLNHINKKTDRTTSGIPPVVRTMKNHIDKNFNKPVKITDLAELSGFSPNYTGKLFREHIGLSVPNYINMLRIRKACDLLANTNMKIYQIAYQVGYSESYYFSNLFKKLLKVSPIEYRKDPAKRNILPFPIE